MKALNELMQLKDILERDINGHKDYHVNRLMITDTARMILRRIEPAIRLLKAMNTGDVYTTTDPSEVKEIAEMFRLRLQDESKD